jgi:hypothetical protein
VFHSSRRHYYLKLSKHGVPLTSVRRLAAEALPKDGTMSFLLTTEVTKSLPDSAKSQVMQAAGQEHFKVLEYHRSTSNNRCLKFQKKNRCLCGTSCNQIPRKGECDNFVVETYDCSYIVLCLF